MMNVLLYLLPYIATGALCFTVGFMVRNGRIDRLTREVLALNLEASGRVVRTSASPEGTVQAPVRTAGTQRPVPVPEHTGERTEPLPGHIRYVPAE